MESKLEKRFEIYYIRHACSYFNLFLDYDKHIKNNMPLTDFTESELDFCKQINDRFSYLLADPKLTIKGISQCISMQEKYNELNIKYLFVSPLRRALETANLLFEKHPNRKNMKIIVFPLITEMLGGPDEISINMTSKIEEFLRFGFDFSLLSSSQPYPYYIENINIPEREILFDLYKKYGSDESEFVKQIGNLSRSRRITNPKHAMKIENYENLRKRAIKSAEYIYDYAIKNGIKSQEIGIVAHDTIIGHSTPEPKFKDYKKVIFETLPNCHYKPINILNLITKK